MGVDTVLVAFRSEDVIEVAVRALEPLAGRVVVVDHGDGRAGGRARDAGALVLEDPSNPGFGSGQNRGVAATGSEFVLLCNPDALVSPGAVQQGVRHLEARPDVAAVQGVIVNQGTGLPERSQGVEVGPVHLLGRAVGGRRLLRLRPVRSLLAHSSTLGDHVRRVPATTSEVESLAATALLVRRSAFEEVGGFDPSFFLYGEDLDLCHRLRLAGWKLLAVPDVWAQHLGGASASSSWEREAQWWRGTMQFAARWWSAGAWSLAMVAAGVRCTTLAPHYRPPGAAFSAIVGQPARLRRSLPGSRASFSRNRVEGSNRCGPLAPQRISVVVRSHQQGRFLAEAVNSVRAQTRPADEIVVVDDGSDDDTASVLAGLEDSGPVVIVRHPRPRGPAASFNSGVSASSGTLVLALDADDALSPRYLELTEQAVLSGADLAYGGVERFGAEHSYQPPQPFDVDEVGVENFLHVSTLFRRSLFDSSGGFRSDLDQLGLEDWEFWVGVVERGGNGQAVDDCWLRYRRHAGGSRNSLSRWQVLRVHLRVHRLHPRVVTRRHLVRWIMRSLCRNVRGQGKRRS